MPVADDPNPEDDVGVGDGPGEGEAVEVNEVEGVEASVVGTAESELDPPGLAFFAANSAARSFAPLPPLEAMTCKLSCTKVTDTD